MGVLVDVLVLAYLLSALSALNLLILFFVGLDHVLVRFFLSVAEVPHLVFVVLVLFDHVVEVVELLLFLNCFPPWHHRIPPLILDFDIVLLVQNLLYGLLVPLLQLLSQVIQVFLPFFELLDFFIKQHLLVLFVNLVVLVVDVLTAFWGEAAQGLFLGFVLFEPLEALSDILLAQLGLPLLLLDISLVHRFQLLVPSVMLVLYF